MVRVWLGVGLLTWGIPFAVSAATEAGKILSVRGEVSIVSEKGAQNVAVAKGSPVHSGDVIATGPNGGVRLLMKDKSLLSLGSKSKVTLKDYTVRKSSQDRKVRMRLWLGRLWARVTKTLKGNTDYTVESANAVAGVRGTEFGCFVPEGGGMSVTVAEGSVAVGPELGVEGVRVLGALQQVKVEASGNLGDINTVSPQQVEQERQASGAGNLNRQNAKDRVKQGASPPANRPGGKGQGGKGQPNRPQNQQGPGNDQGGPPERGLPNGNLPGGVTPGQNLPQFDPGQGKTRIRGRLEVRP